MCYSVNKISLIENIRVNNMIIMKMIQNDHDYLVITMINEIK